MSRDRSLDEFAGTVDGDPGDDVQSDIDVEGDAQATDGTRTNVDTQTDDVDPAATTYQWDPDGVECAECGQTVDRRWSQDGGHVCADCKDW
ncbi:DUF7573 domain-containing protein [Halobellus captivus]|uniref:DUF7573 domain-containing protein n=1 Tax=Halobellus captivus TaxID=2592614 RepID=UPI0011A741D0|nr:hypothetical protein [Halobellus captivus]